MRAIVYSLLAISLIVWACKKPTIDKPPIPNADSLRCVQAWQGFQLPKDTILALRYQQPVKLINGTDTMAITVTQIDDRCSEESAKHTYGCDARIKLNVELSGSCSYQTKYSLTISRYGDGSDGPNTMSFKDFDCNVHRSSEPIINGLTGSVMAYFNTAILFRRLFPFAKNNTELTNLTANPQK